MIKVMSYQGTRMLILSLLLLLFSCKDKVRTKEEQADFDRLRMAKSEKKGKYTLIIQKL